MIQVGKDHGCLVQLWGGCTNYRFHYKERGTSLLSLGGFHHMHNYQSSLFLQANRMVVVKAEIQAYSPLDSSFSLPLHIQPFPQSVLSSPMCSGWKNANDNGGGKNLLQSQFQVGQRCCAVREKKPLYANTARVEESSIAIEEPYSEIRWFGRKNESETGEDSNTSIRSMDMHEEVFEFQGFSGMLMSDNSFRKCASHASKTNMANIKGVIRILSQIGLSSPEIGLVLSKIPFLLQTPPTQLSKTLHVLTQLGLADKSLSGICLQSPELLGNDPDHLTELFEFFQSVEMTKEELLVLLQNKPQVFNHPVEKVKFSVNCLVQAGISKGHLVKVLLSATKPFSPLIQHKLKARLEFLLRIGMTPDVLVKTISNRCNILVLDLEARGSSYAYLTQFLTNEDFLRVISRCPRALRTHPMKITQTVVYLLKRGVTPEILSKVISRAPSMLATEISLMESNYQYLRNLGATDVSISRAIALAPQIVLCGNYEKNLEPKFSYFYMKGFSKEQVAYMYIAYPTMFGLTIKNLQLKLDYLTNEIPFSIEDVVGFPQYFGFSLENRIKPHFKQLRDIFPQAWGHARLSSIVAPGQVKFGNVMLRMQEKMDENH